MNYCTPCARKEDLYTTPSRMVYTTCDLCGQHANCNTDPLKIQETKTQKLEKMFKNKSKTIKKVADGLIKSYGHTTTLQVKKFLRQWYPNTTWNQDEVSDALIEYEISNQSLKYHDNGTFRIYYDVSNPPAQLVTTPVPAHQTQAAHPVTPKQAVKSTVAHHNYPTQKASRTNIVQMMEDSKGRFFTIEYKKQDGSHRVFNGQVKKATFRTALGNIMINEVVGRSRQQRQIDPKRIKSLTINNTRYVAS